MPKQPKQWETWHGMHTFLCDGRIMLGPDIGVTGFAAGLTTAASVAFWVFVCPQLPPVVLVVGALLYALTMFFMIACATTDPGILPRDPTVDDAEAAFRAVLVMSPGHDEALFGLGLIGAGVARRKKRA